MKEFQETAFANNLRDIPYNFLIGGDGNTYEARGFTYKGEIPNSTTSFDDVGIIVAFIGTFDKEKPSASQVTSFNRFLEVSLQQDLLKSDFVLLRDITLNSSGSGLLEFLEEFEQFYNCN